MEKGISFFYGYKIDKNIRANNIKNCGFDCVITTADPRFDAQNGTFENQIEMFKQIGLKISSLHNQYVTADLPNFWLENSVGDEVEQKIKTDILLAQRYGIKCVVVHMFGKYSTVGELRLTRLLETCKNTGVFLAIENINDQPLFVEIFKNIHHSYLKFCYDSGHNNVFDPDFDYLKEYGKYLICLHLHDNNGVHDDHTLNRFGTIDWDNLAKKLAKLDLADVSLDYELLMYNNQNAVSAKECLAETFKQACELEQKILKYKNAK